MAAILALLACLPGVSVSVHGTPSVPSAPGGMNPTIRAPTAGTEGGVSSDRPMGAPAHSIHPLSVVDVNMTYTQEPAPMGIADFGVAADGSGYAYATSAFLGTASIQSLAAHYQFVYRNKTYSGNDISLQLNAELVLSHGGTTVTYWVQDVPAINTSSRQIVMEDNIWNMSGSGSLGTNALLGNGTIYSGAVYIDSASAGYPGNGVRLTYPRNVSAELVASRIGGIPKIGFQYNDGYGWQTFDNVSIPWARNWTVVGFVVDGFSYAPNGVYYDAEWVECGPGSGISDVQDAANFTMGLQYWNGHNFQAVENAFNHGGNTAEAMWNVLPEYSTVASGGTPLAHEGAGVGGRLGMLYDRSEVAVLNVASVYPSSTLLVGPESYTVRGGEVNLTLAPGNYSLTLLNGSLVGDHRTVALVGGEYLALTMGHIDRVTPIWFNETGLPNGTTWSLVVNGHPYTSTNPSLRIALFNGSYNYSVLAIPGYHLSSTGYAGTLSVPGPGAVVLVWNRVVYEVTVTSDGLGAGVPWSISIGGSVFSSNGGSIQFALPNGTYMYTVDVDYRFIVSDPSDLLAIDGQAVPLEVGFAPRYASLAGSVSPSAATVLLNGTEVETGQATFELSALSGTYEVTATLSGYTTFHSNVTLTPGNASVLNVKLTPLPATTSPPGPSAPSSASTGWTTIDTIGAGAVLAAALLVIGIAWARPWRKR